MSVSREGDEAVKHLLLILSIPRVLLQGGISPDFLYIIHARHASLWGLHIREESLKSI